MLGDMIVIPVSGGSYILGSRTIIHYIHAKFHVLFSFRFHLSSMWIFGYNAAETAHSDLHYFHLHSNWVLHLTD